MRRYAILVPMAFLVTCAAPPPEPTSAGVSAPAHMDSTAAQPDCFDAGIVQWFVSVDRDTVRLDSGRRAYEVDLAGPRCDMVEWETRARLESGPSSWICTGEMQGQGRLLFRDQLTQELAICQINAVRPA